jgi:ELWxxDGT repeat protein
MWDWKVITGYNGHTYLTAIKNAGEWPEPSVRLLLWAYDSQSDQLVQLSNDDWYAAIGGHPTPDEGYLFRHLNTPDGLIFVNLTKDTGRELWYTDGTTEGTRQLADINPGSADSNPQNFYHSGDAIYFSADDGVHGREPWRIPISR